MTTRRPLLTVALAVVAASAVVVFVSGQGGLVRNLFGGIGSVDPALLAAGLACSVLSIAVC